jgi:site-specific DNA-methyltransferase (adenine-specific)
LSNRLYYGDNLDILREHVADESVDLIYLDPPFNSKRDYNLLFKTPKGHQSDAQITAFEDSWQWGPQAEAEFHQILKGSNTDVAEVMQALRKFLGDNDMMAYLTMMANRLMEMHRTLKPTGSIYPHCDPTASHYLKVVLDGVFGKENFRNEISWKRSQPKSHTTINFPNCRDVILRYAKTEAAKFFKVYGEHDPAYIEKFYRHADANGRRYQLADLTNPNKDRPNLTYELLGVTRVWRWTRERMHKALKEGLIVQSEPGGIPRLKRYLDELEGQPITDDWDDIEHLHGSHAEALGYPTQKPLALLERIVLSSSEENDVLLDPFCGCGTAVHAAQKLKRQWIGIDITHLAISLIEKRMKAAFPYLLAVSPGTKKAAQIVPNAFEVVGVPRDIDAARDMFERDAHQFQLWACTLVGAQPYKGGKKGADSGIDGLAFPEVEKGKMEKVIVSVKGGKNVGVAMVRDLKGVIQRDKAAIGLFVTLTPPTKEMIKEAASAGFYESPHHGNFPRLQILTVEGLLDGKESAKFPDMAYGGQTFKKAKVENKTKDQGKLF